MNIFIIASNQKYRYAIELINDIDDLHILSTHTTNISNEWAQYNNSRNELSKADIVLVLIDHEFTDRKSLMGELEMAISISEKMNTKIIPIVFDNASVPNILRGFLYISCSSESNEQLINAKREIEKISNQINSSRHKKDNKHISKGLVLFEFLFFLVCLFISLVPFLWKDSFRNSDLFKTLFFSLGISLLAIISILIILQVLDKTNSKKNSEEKEEIEDYSKRLQKVITSFDTSNNSSKNTKSNSPKIDALGRMLINLEDIKQFYTWSQKQAKAAFVLALSLCIAGFILMSLAIILPIVFELNLQISIASAISGSIVEVIAGTALVVYRHSIAQLKHYHKALHEDERFLSSVNLLDQFDSTSARDELLKDIISSEINMNLEELKTNN